MRTQLRAICSFCGRDIAITKGGHIHEHGYHKDQGYKVSGSCPGSWVMHFGTELGRNWTEKRATKHLELSTTMTVKDDPKATAKERAAHKYTAQILSEMVANWKEAAPVEVKIFEETPTIHLAAIRYRRNSALCVASAMGAERFRGNTTDDPEQVTCTRCLKQMQWKKDMEEYKAYVADVVATKSCPKCGKPLQESYGEVECSDYFDCGKKFKLEMKKPK